MSQSALSGTQFHATLREVGSWRSNEYDRPMDTVPAMMVHDDEHDIRQFGSDDPHVPYVKEIAKSIKKSGYDETKPIKAYIDYDGRPAVGDGHHRFAAAREAGLTHIPVKWSENW